VTHARRAVSDGATGAQVFGEVSTRTGRGRLAPLPRRQAEPACVWSRMGTWPDARIAGRRLPVAGAMSPPPGGAASNGEGGLVGAAAAEHVPVMLDRVAALLAPALSPPGAVLVDATLGRAGHALALLDAHPGLLLIGVDRDIEAIDRSRRLLACHARRVTLVHARYDEIPAVLGRLGHPQVQGVLFDLGVSSPQLDQPERGFSYAADGPLDMRMDRAQELTAADVVNGYDAGRLAHVLHEYGEERHARRIAAAIVRVRARAAINSTSRLSEIVRAAIPAAARRTGGNPAKRTFQALRIEVNAELAVLERAIPGAMDALRIDGRIIVLAYHSLEDRIVKRAFAARVTDTTPAGLPVPLAAARPTFQLLTRGAQRPAEDETTRNPRASSARLRGAQRVAA
jgi:16S rRNA (cytosine1402-N4)-methyltransferase